MTARERPTTGTAPQVGRSPGAPGRRVLFVSHYAGATGAPLLLLHFLRWVRAHTDLRFEVLLLEHGRLVSEFAALAPVHVVNHFGPPDPRSFEARARALGWNAVADRSRARRLAREAATLGSYDAVFLNSALAVAGLRYLPVPPRVVVTSLHETDTAFSRFISEEDRREILRRSDWFVTCADVVSATLVGGFEVDRRRVRRHYGFVEPISRDPAAGARTRAALGIPDDAVVVGASGVRQWRKGPDLFVQVAAGTLGAHPGEDVHFVWTGGPDPHGDDPPLREDAAHLGIGDRLHELSEYGDVAATFSAFDVFCLTSREDPFPLVMLEAAMLGVPIVAFDNGGVAELALAGGDPAEPLALVVDYLDVDAMVEALVGLVKDPHRREALGERARAHVLAEHVPDVAAPRLYEDLCRMDPAFS